MTLQKASDKSELMLCDVFFTMTRASRTNVIQWSDMLYDQKPTVIH